MNTPQMHARVRALLDQVKSPRITRALIDQFLNVAHRRYYNFCISVFESNQLIRDEFKPLVVNNASLTPVGDVFTYPADYEHELGFAVVVNGKTYMSTEMTYNEQNAVMENAFTEPTQPQTQPQPYHIESAAGVTSYYGTGNVLSGGFLSYAVILIDVYWSSTAISAGLTALTIGQTYYVATAPVTSATITYAVGDTFVATSTAFTGAGTVNAIKNSQLGISCHEELCKIAAAEIAGSLDDTQSFQIQALGTKPV